MYEVQAGKSRSHTQQLPHLVCKIGRPASQGECTLLKHVPTCIPFKRTLTRFLSLACEADASVEVALLQAGQYTKKHAEAAMGQTDSE